MKKKEICPFCKDKILGYPAISRRDNKTLICSKCGIIESLNDFIKYEKETGDEDNVRKRME